MSASSAAMRAATSARSTLMWDGAEIPSFTRPSPQAVTVTQIQGDMVTLDGNHPLAGKNLNFDIEITDVRVATEEELEHGHVHAAGDHHHH